MANKKNIEHIWSVMCQSSIIDQESNNVSLIDILESISFSLPPERVSAISLPFEVVTLWRNSDPGKKIIADVEMDIVGPNGKSLQKFVNKIEFTESKKRLRFRLRINAIPFVGFGEYSCQVNIKESGGSSFETVAVLPLEIRQKI